MTPSWGREIVVVLFRNALMAAFVFVPVMFLITPLNAMLLGVNPEGGLSGFVAFVVFFYISVAVPGIMGSVVHSIVVILIPKSWPRCRRQLLTVLLSPLLPATIFMLGGLREGDFMYDFWVATTIATVAYGLCSSLWLPRITEKNIKKPWGQVLQSRIYLKEQINLFD